MSIIIDANRAGDFTAPCSGHAKEILCRLLRRTLKVVSGGKLHKELCRTKLRGLLAELQRTGQLKLIDDNIVEAEILKVRIIGYSSDDEHVLGLLRSCSARILYTADIALIDDARNPNLVMPPATIITLGMPSNTVIPPLLQNPKVLVGDDAEVV